jgi:hypothetical protein
MIFCGYPCVGKSSVVKEFNKRIGGIPAIDLESSLFSVDGTRDENWYKVYANIAKDFDGQGYIVFCSSHGKIRSYMDEQNIEYVNVYPGLNLKSKWCDKAVYRLKETGLEKDRLAMNRILDCYEKDIKELASHDKTLELTNSDYSLYKSVLEYIMSDKDKVEVC